MFNNEFSSEQDKFINSILDEGIMRMQRQLQYKQNLNFQTNHYEEKKNIFPNDHLNNYKTENNLNSRIGLNLLEDTRKVLKYPSVEKENTIKDSNNKKQKGNLKKSKESNKIDYKAKFEKLKNQVSNTKNELVQEKKVNIKLKKQFEKAEKKEQDYFSLVKKNQMLAFDNEELYNKILNSENIRNEQEKLLKTLQIEYNRLKKFFGSDDKNEEFMLTQNINQKNQQPKNPIVKTNIQNPKSIKSI